MSHVDAVQSDANDPQRLVYLPPAAMLDAQDPVGMFAAAVVLLSNGYRPLQNLQPSKVFELWRLAYTGMRVALAAQGSQDPFLFQLYGGPYVTTLGECGL